MVLHQFQTEWIATHLLFPNSTQARDIFLHVVSELPSSSDKSDLDSYYFKKICQHFYKTQPISSALIFSEFSESKINLWPGYFKKLNNDEKLLIVGIVFCELSEKKLSVIFKCSESVLQQKIKNTFYKIIPKNEPALKTKYQFSYKKYNSTAVSDFFIYDDIIDSIIKPKSDTHVIQKNTKITEQISNSIVFKKYAMQIQDFKNELQNLKTQKYNIPFVKDINPVQTENNSQETNFGFKKYAPLGAAIVAVTVFLVYRPQFIREMLNEKPVQTIEIQQVKIDRKIENEMSPSKVNSTVQSETANSSAAKLDAQIPHLPVIESSSKPEQKNIIDVSDKKLTDKNKSGGLYRGRLIVTDLQQIIGVAKEKIIYLGGQKAGEVELGWMKNEGTSYFHFSFPDENKKDLENFLKQFGQLELVFEPHPRAMPKGFKRYIIEIKQNE